MNPFAYTDNNPINAIDPDGRDKIFINSSGSIIKIVNDGKKDIVIIDHNGNRNNLSSYKFNSTGSYFSNNNYNRQVVANVVGHYLRKELGSSSRLTANMDTDGGDLSHQGGRFLVSPNSNGGMKETYNNKNNLINAIHHEKFHKEDFDAGITSTLSTHFDVYNKQINHSSFSNASEDYQLGVVSKAAQYLIQASESDPNADNFIEKIKQFNKGSSRFKLQGIDGQTRSINVYKDNKLKATIDRGNKDLDSNKH